MSCKVLRFIFIKCHKIQSTNVKIHYNQSFGVFNSPKMWTKTIWLEVPYSKSELVSRVNFDRNISPNSKGRSPIFLLGWPALGDCSICDIIPSNLSSGSFLSTYLAGSCIWSWVSHQGLSIIPSDFLKNQSLKIIRKCLLYIFGNYPHLNRT